MAMQSPVRPLSADSRSLFGSANRWIATKQWPAIPRVGRELMVSVFWAAMTALGAQARVPLPGTPIPMTLQACAVLVTGLVLSPLYAAGAMLLYLGAGAVGLPVFSPGSSGVFGAAGGYLVAFPLCAWLVSVLKGSQGRSAIRMMFASATGMIVLFGVGVAWLAVVLGQWMAAVQFGLFPFVWKGVVEVVLAVAIAASGYRLGLIRNETRNGF